MKTGRDSTEGVVGAYCSSSMIGLSEHDRSLGVGEIAADLERRLVDLRRHAAVVQQVVDEVPQAVDEAAATGLPRAFQRRRVAEQKVRRRESVGQQAEQEVRAFAIDRVETDRVDPLMQTAFERDPVLRDAFEDRLFGKRRIAETRVLRIGCRVGSAEHDAHGFLPQTRRVVEADRGLQQALAQYLHTRADDVGQAKTHHWIQRQRAVRRRLFGLRDCVVWLGHAASEIESAGYSRGSKPIGL